MECLKQFRIYLISRRFRLFTDHAALKQILNEPDPRGRRARWISRLAEFDYEVIYRRGADNVVADALSRQIGNESVNNLGVVGQGLDGDADELLVVAKTLLEGGSTPEGLDAQARRKVGDYVRQLYLQEGELWRKRYSRPAVRVLVSRRARRDALNECHNAWGHFGVRTTWEFVSLLYWWPKLGDDVRKWCESCPTCQMYEC